MTSANTTSTSIRDPVSVAVDYDPFADAPLARVVPSTEAQREIWLAAKLERDASLAYNESSSLRFSGRLDAERLHAALQALTDRHETLRATLSANGEELLIAEHVDIDWRMRDLSSLDGAARDAEIAATLLRVVDTPCDLEKGPLLRAELLRLADDDHLLVITAHHVVCDGWSWGVLVNELAALYRGTAVAALAAVDSYGDYALEQAARAGTDDYRSDEAYWLGRFTGTTPALDLPTDRPRPRQRTFASRREDHVLDAALISGLKALGAKRRSSLFATLTAAFGVLLQRLSGQDDIVIGIPAAGQAAGGHQSLVGHCVNVLPLRASIEPAMPMTDILERVRSDLLDAFDHQQYTVGTLLKRLALARDPSRLTLVSVLFNLDQALDESRIDFGGLGFRFFGNPRTFENFELFVNAVQVGGTLRIECQYNSDLFDAVTVRRWLEGYETLLRAWLAAPDASAGTLSMVSPSELEAIKRQQSAPTPFERDALVCDLIFAQAERTPDRTAISDAAKRWSYAELAARAHAIAQALRARNVGGGALVGLSMQRSGDMIAAALGVLEAGAAYVPLDPSFPAERLRFMVEDANLALLLTESALGQVIDWPAERTLLLDVPDALGAAPAARAPRSGTEAQAPAYVIYTSGSTGKPKGVRVPHRAIVNFLTSMQREPGLGANDRLLAVTTLSFDIAVLELFLPLTVGAEVVIALREQAMDGHALGDLLEASEATVMQATPATWRVLLETDWRGPPGFKALCGGEALPRELAVELLTRCGSLWNMYGPTETTVWSTCCRIEHPERGIPIGHPIANTTVWILDAQRKPCPIGVPGEIAIGGEGVTLGYLDRPELTADRFIADAYSTRGGTLYRTGDRGRWRNDGTLEHLGRFDFQVKVRGFRIELGEIESVLAAQADVARTVAITREDRPGDVRLVAYVVLRAGATLDEQALRTHLRTRLPDYMIPQHFVALAAIPLLPNGKIDRRSLPAPGAQTTATHIAPRNALEQRVAAAMEETLALPGIGVYDDFFALGGHSLLAAQLTARLNREFAAALSLRSIFDTPTVAGLAEAITATHGGDAAAERIVARREQRIAPLSLLQKRLWLFEQINPGNVVYNTPSAHRLRGPLDEHAFTRAFDEIVRRQSVLRTSIEYVGEEVVQKIHEAVPVALFPAEDLSQVPDGERDAELMRRLDELTNRPFDLSQAPLFRARMFRLAQDDHVLFFMPHHIVWDGWSFDLFYEEFATVYRAFKAGHSSPLEPLPISYGDFAHWHVEWLKGEEYATQFQRQLARWRERLTTRGAPPPLPADRSRGSAMAGVGDTEWLKVTRERTEAMREVGRRADGTLFMALLAAYYALLYRIVGDGHLIVGTPVRVRRSTDIEKVMGLFTNLLPLPIDVEPTMTFLELVARVKAVVLEGFSHPEVQLEDLMREPGMREAAGATHFYQAQFSYQDARQRDIDWGGLHHEHLPLFQRGASEDLSVWFLEHGAGMIGGVLYNADVLDPATARRIAADYLALLDRVIAHPSQTLSELTRVDAAELQAIRQLSVPAQVELPAPTVHALFEAAADARPGATALSFGSWTTTYRELDQRANRMAACLRRRGVGASSAVGLVSGHGQNRLAAMLAILKCGASCVPLDPNRKTAELADILADAEASVLICDSLLLSALTWPRERALCFDLDATEWMAASSERVAGDEDADALAIVLYPGSETPRGIGLTHRGLVNLVSGLGVALDIHAGDAVLGIGSPEAHESLVETLLGLGTGAELVQAAHSEIASGAALRHWLDERKSSTLLAPPTVWRALADAGWTGGGIARAVCLGPMDTDLATDLLSRCESLWATFGVTEATMISTCGRVTANLGGLAGRPLQNSAVWVLDESGRPSAIGASGRVHLGGVGIGRPAGRRSRAEPAFVVSSHAGPDDVPLLATGRRGRLRADGTLEIFIAPAAFRPLHAQKQAADASAAAPPAPLTPQQIWLIGIWKDLLGTHEVDVDDNFFDLGGHSLLAMSMVAKVEKQTRVRLNLLKIANSTLRVLAAELPETAGTGAAPEAQVTIGQRVRSLFGLGRRPAGE